MKHSCDKAAIGASYLLTIMLLLFLHIVLSSLFSDPQVSAVSQEKEYCTISTGCSEHHDDFLINHTHSQSFTLVSSKEGGRNLTCSGKSSPTYFPPAVSESSFRTDYIYSPANLGKIVIQYRNLRI